MGSFRDFFHDLDDVLAREADSSRAAHDASNAIHDLSNTRLGKPNNTASTAAIASLRLRHRWGVGIARSQTPSVSFRLRALVTSY